MNEYINIKIQIEETKYSAPSQWRLIGAKAKSRNIIELCKRHNIQAKKVLEVGAGDGAILKWLDENQFCKELFALEISESGVEVIRNLGLNSLKKVEVFDGYKIPFENNEFDLVILSHVLEHVEFERILLREIQRVSEYQVIEIPVDYSSNADAKYIHLMSYGHINIYNPVTFRFLLQTEKYHIIDDLINRYDSEVMEYIYFELNGNQRTAEAESNLRNRYRQALLEFQALSREKQESCASTYTVLTKAIDIQQLFEDHLSLARHYYEVKQINDARLILNYLIQNERLKGFELPAWAKEILTS